MHSAALRLAILALVVLAGPLSCRTAADRRAVLPVLEAADVDPARGFESPPRLRASEILTPEQLRGPHHEVAEEVVTDGFLHHYRVISEFGDFDVVGDAMLRVRIQEIAALASLRDLSRTREFAGALREGLQSPFVAAWNLLTDPVDSLLGVPRQAWESVRGAAELARGQRGAFEDRALREFLGFERTKRELAHRVGVDPYSSNTTLQRELNRTAWVTHAGRLPFRFVPFQKRTEDPMGPLAGADARLAGLLRNDSPEDLRRLNRIELAVMGIDPDLVEAFLAHRWLSPRHQTILVASLVELERAEDRRALVATALSAKTEEDALFYQRSAEMLRAYDAGVGRIVRLSRREAVVSAYAADGARLTPLLVDHLVWTRPVAERARMAARTDPAGVVPSRLEIWLSGTASEKARRELEALGFVVVERAFERLAAASPEIAPAALEASPRGIR